MEFFLNLHSFYKRNSFSIKRPENPSARACNMWLALMQQAY